MSMASPHRERGFALIELIMVMVIIAILMTMVMVFGRSSKSAAHQTSVLAAAQAYDQGIKQFAGDHARRYPLAIGSIDWPTAEHGPVSELARNDGRYLRTTPESVQDGNVVLNADGPWGRLDYAPSANGYDYELRVSVRDGETMKYRCSYSSSALAGASKPCHKGG